MKVLIDRAIVEQALEALEWVAPSGLTGHGGIESRSKAITNLRAVLAQQAEPDHETRAELAEQQVVQLAEERDHYRNLWQKAQQAESVQEPAAWRYKPMIGSPWSLSDDGYYISCKRDQGYIVEALGVIPTKTN